MIFSIILFIVSGMCFFLFADKEKLVAFTPTCLLAMYLACTTDMLTNVYPLWYYPATDKTHMFFRHVLHDFGVYPIVTYLFIQTLPKTQTFAKISLHIFYWSIPAFIIEWLATKTGNMEYGLWWNKWCSYITDGILFLLFYSHHKWRESGTTK